MAAVLHKPVQFNELRETIRAHMRPVPARPSIGPAATASDTAVEASPCLDTRQLDEMIGLFGPEAFREDMAVLFEADFERHLDALKTAIADGHGTAARASLHALKSCANTIGAPRLADLCNDKREDSEAPDEGLTARITAEYTAFKQALHARLGSAGHEHDPGAARGHDQAIGKSR